MKNVLRGLLLCVGTLSVALGVLGIFVPLLPTTPFFLLAASCYARSSTRVHQWLMTNPWFGEYINNYREGRGMPLREKVLTLTALWVTIGFAAAFVIAAWWGKLALLGMALGVTVHLLRLKTYSPAVTHQHAKESRQPEEVESGRMSRTDKTEMPLPNHEAAEGLEPAQAA
jgi:uncharacterized membrane protein YbaN (DUF454 family)